MKNFGENMQKLGSKFSNSLLILFFILVFGLGLRLWYFPFDVPIATDGFFSFVYASKTVIDQALPIGYDTTNSGWSNFLSIIFFFFDKSDPLYMMGIQRVTSIVLSCLTIIPGFFIFNKFTNAKIALVGCLVLAVEPRMLLISLEGINFSIFFFLIVLTIGLFLNKNKSIRYLSFVCVGLLSLIRYEGVLLFIPLAIMFLRNSSKKEFISKIFVISIIIGCIIIPVSLLRMDATAENCYEIGKINICGRDGILSSFFDRTSDMNNRIQGIPDLDDRVSYDNERILKFIFYSVTNFSKFFSLSLIPVFIIFISLTIISLKKNEFLKKKSDLLILFILTCFLILPSFYAYGRDFLEIRYVLVAIPLLVSFSMFGIDYFSNKGKNRKILIFFIIIILAVSIIFLHFEARDRLADLQSFEISKKIVELTDTTNTYYQSGYIKTALLVSDWPDLPAPKDNGKLPQNFKKISIEKYEHFEDFMKDSRNLNLKYIVVEEHNKIFAEFNKNKAKYGYLEKVFDSRDLGFEKEFSIYKINYEEKRT